MFGVKGKKQKNSAFDPYSVTKTPLANRNLDFYYTRYYFPAGMSKVEGESPVGHHGFGVFAACVVKAV